MKREPPPSPDDYLRGRKESFLPGAYDLADLQNQTFPELKQIVGEIIVEGCTLLAARPKVGKTWLMLEAAIAVAEGSCCLGTIACQPGAVLFLALEDNRRRMQRRVTKLLGANKGQWPHLTVVHSWPRADHGGLDQIRQWIGNTPGARLVIVDVLARFRKLVTNRQSYEADYEAIAELQKIASDTGVAIVVVHHTRKGEADDPLDAVSGTLGLVGAADAVLIISRDGQSIRLYGRSRDVDEIDKAMSFDTSTCQWCILGNTADVWRSTEQQEILAVLEEPRKLAEIAALVGKSVKAVWNLLERMIANQEVIKTGRGTYEKARMGKVS